jgi:anti-sigma factor ChrR (cupin superfamily)
MTFQSFRASQLPRVSSLAALSTAGIHPSDFLIERYASGRISSERQLDRIEDHIGMCNECRKRVERIDAIRSIRRALQAEALPIRAAG